MNRKSLENKLKTEGKSFTPNVLDNVYQKLGISFQAEQKPSVMMEKKLSEEAKVFVPNVKENVYRACNISQLDNQDHSLIENRLFDESNSFVPNVKDGVYNQVGKKKPRLTFAQFMAKPATIGFVAAGLVAVVASAVVIPNVIANDSNSPKLSGTINLDITSASKAYTPETMYTVDEKGNVKGDEVISLNDESTNIILNFENSNSKAVIEKQYSVSSFTNTYLTSALNLGYIERQDISKSNVISISISCSKIDKNYYSKLSQELKSQLEDFIYKNKIVADVEVSLESEEVEGVDSELAILIKKAYDLATKLFVDSDGNTIKVLCFSTSFDDWIEKYKDTSVEEMQAYVDYLLLIQDKISTDEDKDRFLNDLAECTAYQEAADVLASKYQLLEEAFDNIIEALGDVHEEDPFTFEDDGWDWWDDYGYEDHDHHERSIRWDEPYDEYQYDSLEDYNKFIEKLDSLDLAIKDGDSEEELRMKLDKIIENVEHLSRFQESFDHIASKTFEKIMGQLDNGDYYSDHHDYDNHYEEKPDGWDNDYEAWWGEHHHH